MNGPVEQSEVTTTLHLPVSWGERTIVGVREKEVIDCISLKGAYI